MESEDEKKLAGIYVYFLAASKKRSREKKGCKFQSVAKLKQHSRINTHLILLEAVDVYFRNS